ncbi:uracil-xanthine permease family protein [Geminisphaera colitermitum]|uniref:uracil-xanthine permease family protein n=1 Tax=Geminisphaera colitermitum TaxID=1148786 RepID=UPI000158CCC0|nr:uracil-xanthine permease family protein [Geminisphaera colitermitum]
MQNTPPPSSESSPAVTPAPATTASSAADYKFRFGDALIGAQMLFVAFGALVLVPILTGLNPNVALFTAGLGTLIYQIITRGRVPVFIASSFAFIAPISAGVEQWGIPGTLCGLVGAGVMYFIVGALIKWRGIGLLQKILPPVVIGPVVMVIGLLLAPVGAGMAMGKTPGCTIPTWQALTIAGISLATMILVSLRARGMLRLLPILCGIGAGYVASMAFGYVDFNGIKNAAWIAVPAFTAPVWNLSAILFIAPVALAPIIEHYGAVQAIGQITGRDYVANPGIHRCLVGDGLATSVAGMLGGPPCTTYSEVIGAVALTRAFNPAIMTWAAVTAIALAFVGKVGAILGSIPVPVMGGIMTLLFGAIATVGLQTLVRAKQDLLEPRNMTIVSLILVCGIGGMVIGDKQSFALEGIGLAGILGIVLNLILPKARKE